MGKHVAPLPAEILAALRDDPAYRVLTMDGGAWFDPYSGEPVAAPEGWEAAARAQLQRLRPWQSGVRPKPLRELLYLRWYHYLRENLDFVPALRVFRNGQWLNPYSGRWQPGPDATAMHQPARVAEHLALALSQCAEASGGRMLDRRSLEELALRGPVGDDPQEPLALPAAPPAPAAPRAGEPSPRAVPIARPSGRAPAATAVREATPSAGHGTGTRRLAARSDHVALKQSLLQMLRRPPRLHGHQLVVHFAPHAPMPRDFYDFIELPGGRLLIVLGHVFGTGPGCALLAGAALDQLRALAPRCATPAGLVAALNDGVRADLVHGSAIGLCAAQLDPATGRLTVVAAGHPPAVVLSSRRDAILVQLRATGASLGTLLGEDFLRSLDQVEIDLAPGDVVLLPGQGLARAADPRDPDAGRWAILGTAVECAKRTCGELLERVIARAKAGGDASREDLAGIALRVKDESWLLEART